MNHQSWQPDQGLFGISVASELCGVSIQALRGYEDKGLLEPTRTDGGTRRYSTNDVADQADQRARGPGCEFGWYWSNFGAGGRNRSSARAAQ